MRQHVSVAMAFGAGPRERPSDLRPSTEEALGVAERAVIDWRRLSKAIALG